MNDALHLPITLGKVQISRKTLITKISRQMICVNVSLLVSLVVFLGTSFVIGALELPVF